MYVKGLYRLRWSCAIQLVVIKGVPHIWSCSCHSVCCYFWFLFLYSLLLSPHPASSLSLCLSLLCSLYQFLCLTVLPPHLHRKRHRSCDSEEDQQLSPQAKRSGGGPSLLVSDLDSEVRLNGSFLSSLDHHTELDLPRFPLNVWWILSFGRGKLLLLRLCILFLRAYYRGL